MFLIPPPSDSTSLGLVPTELLLPTAEATQGLAACLAQGVTPGMIVLLQGELGSGKTTFTQGFGRGLGITEPITSPTFTLIQEYWEGRIPLFHVDLYRLDPVSVFDLGLEELYEAGVLVIEWPQRLPVLPPAWMRLTLDMVGEDIASEGRRIRVSWQGDRYARLWETVFRQQIVSP